jgi:hypothetical protein
LPPRHKKGDCVHEAEIFTTAIEKQLQTLILATDKLGSRKAEPGGESSGLFP